MKKLFILGLAGFLSLNAFSFSPVSAQSYQGTADLLVTISLLQQQVAALQTQLNQNKGGQNNAVPNTLPSIDYLSGPTRLIVNAIGTWTARASDADGNLMRWDVSWGDNSSSSRSASGSSSMVTLDHSYATAGLKNIIFKIWDTNWAYDVASTTVNIITPNIKRLPFQGASFIGSAQEQLATMMLQLQEMLKNLR